MKASCSGMVRLLPGRLPYTINQPSKNLLLQRRIWDKPNRMEPLPREFRARRPLQNHLLRGHKYNRMGIPISALLFPLLRLTIKDSYYQIGEIGCSVNGKDETCLIFSSNQICYTKRQQELKNMNQQIELYLKPGLFHLTIFREPRMKGIPF